ncbi:MAG: tRNA epoxyqueuosine(34) reductase QueG [Bryobacteraceae bacterium]|jgi:epoxyqueuosine reductase
MTFLEQRETPTRERFRALARAWGFELAGVAAALPPAEFPFYRQWVEDGLAGPMGYLTDHRLEARADPRRLLASARSVLCVGKLYKTQEPESTPGAGTVSRYAWGAGDYHDVLCAALERLAARLKEFWGEFEHRVCVDTAPLLERAYAQAAGLGWIGNNTCLINQPLGSWFFLGEILISVALPTEAPPPARCGSCTRCIDVCPTQALVPNTGAAGPAWQLDARLCISTLTIEQRGATPEPTRAPQGNHLFGCDLCQEVCPWNRRAPSTTEIAFLPLNSRLDLEAMAAISRSEFRARFRRTPLWRARYEGWLRNVATAMGNSGGPRYRPALERLAASDDAGVAEHARWALERLPEPGAAAPDPIPPAME